jgi:AraC family transcriptional regulator
MKLPNHFFKGRKLDTLVENKTSYTLQHAEVHVYETHQQADKILLNFDQPVLASMIQGKKVMHLKDQQSFDFLPGESLILPAEEMMCIDFPEAREQNPTRCLALTISEEKIWQTVTLMNETMPRADQREWGLMDYSFHFTHDEAIFHLLQRLLYLFRENHELKDVFVENLLQELIIRILQTNTRKIYTHATPELQNENRLAFVIQYIRDHLQSPLNTDELSAMACMSKSHFHRVFKNEVGMSPVDFINSERIRLAASLLRDPKRSIKEVYLACGFENRSYFNRLFKRKKKVSPSAYQNGQYLGR